jgi:hypothetical protein
MSYIWIQDKESSAHNNSGQKIATGSAGFKNLHRIELDCICGDCGDEIFLPSLQLH